MTKDIGKYIDGYDMEVPAEKLKLSEIPEKLWTYLIVNFIIKLLLVAGKDNPSSM